MSEFRQYRPNNFPPVVKNLVIVNILVWIAQVVFDKQYGLTGILALYPFDVPQFKPYQLITHMFAHAAHDEDGSVVFYHVLFNMFALWMFGRILENVWGGKRFLIFYLISGLGAAVVHLAVQHFTGTYDIAVGASGAIMGVLVGFAYLFPNTELFILFIPFPIKAKWAAIGYVVIDLVLGLVGASGDNVAHFAHLGGALTGFLLVHFWKQNRQRFY